MSRRHRRTPLALAAVLLTAAAVAVGCGGHADNDTIADCAGRFTWHGQEYSGNGGFRDAPPTGAALTPKATNYFCDDARPVTAYRIQGVDPLLALRDSPGESPTIWLAAGSFPQLPGHPLHRAFFGSKAKPYRAGDHRRCTLHGRVMAAGDDLAVADDAGEARVIVDARTRITGAPSRAGQPWLREGQAASITARRCRDAGDDPPAPRQMTAVRIRIGS